MRLSEALLCFRASRVNFLRSIPRAIVNKNDGKRLSDFFDVILRLSEALVCFRASGANFLRFLFLLLFRVFVVELTFRRFFKLIGFI